MVGRIAHRKRDSSFLPMCRFWRWAGDTAEKVASNKASEPRDVQLRERFSSSSARVGGTGEGLLAACGN